MTHFDVVIIGGGFVGLSLALALQDTSLNIALVDAKKIHSDTSADGKLFALNYFTCEFLKKINCWDELFPFAEPMQEVHVSKKGKFGSVRLRATDVNLPYLGHVIPASSLEKILQLALHNNSRIQVFQPAILKNITASTLKTELIIGMQDEEKNISADLVIGADGTHSTVRQLLDIATRSKDYLNSALVTRTYLQREHKNIAYERFTKTGAIAMLPLKNNECATIWTDGNQKISELLNMTDGAFTKELQREFGYRLGRLVKNSARLIYPLHKIYAEKNSQGRVLLIGNAAHTIHPVAAQGLNISIQEIAFLVKRIKENLATSEHAISEISLQRISKELAEQQLFNVNLSDNLTAIFSNTSFFMALATQFGMLGMDIISPLKKKFIFRLAATKIN